MQPPALIPPVAVDELLRELDRARLVKATNRGGNLIYDFNAAECPALMREVGRLREEAFREAGGGTGKPLDIDEFDTAELPFKQLIVWDPQLREILGGYRYIVGSTLPAGQEGAARLATSHLFRFSQRFVDDILPAAVELGRSFVQPKFQSSRAGARAPYALDNLWDGLGNIAVEHPEVRYFFGKVTMYTSYDSEARNLIMGFWKLYFSCQEPPLVTPMEPLAVGLEEDALRETFTGSDFRADYRTLVRRVRERGVNIPPLVNAYMMLSPSMQSFGTAINHEFGGVEETAILIDIRDVYPDKAQRHIGSRANADTI